MRCAPVIICTSVRIHSLPALDMSVPGAGRTTGIKTALNSPRRGLYIALLNMKHGSPTAYTGYIMQLKHNNANLAVKA